MNLSKKVGVRDIVGQLKNKNVLMRVDFNVPLLNGVVKDATRIKSTIPTFETILDGNPQNIVLMSHLGRPNGNANQKFSLKPVVPALEDLLQKKVRFIDDCVGNDVAEQVRSAKGEIILLENLRFYKEEEGKGVNEQGEKVKADEQSVKAFRQKLTSYGDVYVNDAFGTSHRAHSSIVGIDLPVKAAGLLLKKELDYFGRALENPQRPLLVILGGAKVSDKIKLINNILNIADELIIGGGMAFTFLRVMHNVNIGNSKYDEEGAKLVPEILEKARSKGVKITLPVDFVNGSEFSNDCSIYRSSLSEGIKDGYLGMDCGEQTIKLNRQAVQNAHTIIWNGPQGVFEFENFKDGSVQLLHDVINRTTDGAISIIGGGDTVNLVQSNQAQDKVSHVSTGGGASLELLEGKILPGVKVIDEL